MKRNNTNRLCSQLLFLGIFCMCFLMAFADKAKEVEDLKRALSGETDPAAAISILSQLSLLHRQQPEQVGFLLQQYKLAMEIDSFPAVYYALEDLAIYYYNQDNKRDSLLYWEKKIDSIARSRNEYPNSLFLTKSLSGRDLLLAGDYEMAMNEILDLYQLATDKKQTYGLICSSECLGKIYQSVARDSDALVAYQEGLDLLDNYDPDGDVLKEITERERMRIQLRMVGPQLESAIRSDQYQVAEAVAERYKELIQKQEMKNRTTGEKFSVKREYLRLYSLCLEMYARSNQMDKAAEMLKRVDEFTGSALTNVDYVIRLDLYSHAYYYYKCGKYAQALSYINKSLSQVRLPRELALKADILKKQGQLEEALSLYDEIYSYNERNNDDTFMRQINQLRTLHEINNRETQERELAYNSRLMGEKQKQLVFSCLIVALLLISLYILYLYIRRTKRLSSELQREKESLLHSERKLILEMEKAQEASQMKSTFVANMSHEIRTPLNAIVGFSALLIDESAEPEEKAEYASIIKNNTNLLLNLVNDVLDLSRMEMGDLNFDLHHYALLSCCREALDSVRPRVKPDVKLTFTPAAEEIIVYTDTLRLQQLLTNLLTNSIKFTIQGEINLAYTLEEDRKHVRITVTDTGYGIPEDKQSTIFQRFEKLDEYKPGTGLGLSICSLIAEHLGGRIFFDPSYKNGARFVFIHPCETSASV